MIKFLNNNIPFWLWLKHFLFFPQIVSSRTRNWGAFFGCFDVEDFSRIFRVITTCGVKSSFIICGPWTREHFHSINYRRTKIHYIYLFWELFELFFWSVYVHTKLYIFQVREFWIAFQSQFVRFERKIILRKTDKEYWIWISTQTDTNTSSRFLSKTETHNFLFFMHEHDLSSILSLMQLHGTMTLTT